MQLILFIIINSLINLETFFLMFIYVCLEFKILKTELDLGLFYLEGLSRHYSSHLVKIIIN